MTSEQPTPMTDGQLSARRRARARRVVAFAGMLTTVAGLIGVRTMLTPTPRQALSSSGLAVQTGGHGAGGGAAPATHAHRAASGRNVLVGRAYDVSYGVVQVKVTMTGQRITDVTPLQLPEGGRSGDISQFAAPQLRREALTAQSAHIDTVSGASYTSAGYARSLQSALDRSGR
jgi:uncharacterized protein with FMN-binding domain